MVLAYHPPPHICYGYLISLWLPFIFYSLLEADVPSENEVWYSIVFGLSPDVANLTSQSQDGKQMLSREKLNDGI